MSNTAAAQMVSFSMMINKPGYQAMINRTIQDPARARRFISAITSAVSINPSPAFFLTVQRLHNFI